MNTTRGRRGKALEPALNRVFEAWDPLIEDAFTLRGEEREGIVEH